MTHADRPSRAGRRTTGGPLSFPLVLSLLGTLASCATVLPGAQDDLEIPGTPSVVRLSNVQAGTTVASLTVGGELDVSTTLTVLGDVTVVAGGGVNTNAVGAGMIVACGDVAVVSGATWSAAMTVRDVDTSNRSPHRVWWPSTTEHAVRNRTIESGVTVMIDQQTIYMGHSSPIARFEIAAGAKLLADGVTVTMHSTVYGVDPDYARQFPGRGVARGAVIQAEFNLTVTVPLADAGGVSTNLGGRGDSVAITPTGTTGTDAIRIAGDWSTVGQCVISPTTAHDIQIAGAMDIGGDLTTSGGAATCAVTMDRLELWGDATWTRGDDTGVVVGGMAMHGPGTLTYAVSGSATAWAATVTGMFLADRMDHEAGGLAVTWVLPTDSLAVGCDLGGVAVLGGPLRLHGGSGGTMAIDRRSLRGNRDLAGVDRRAMRAG